MADTGAAQRQNKSRPGETPRTGLDFRLCEQRLCAQSVSLSVFGSDWSTTPAETIVHTELDSVLVVPEARTEDLRGPAGESRVAEIVVLVLELGRPARREHVFEARTDRPTILVGAIGRERHRRTAE